ncbi:DNA ligase-associated DEXH box helicase [Sphingorhabdus lutea]|uniref:DNA ligase-associated DEXH box helicase n=1 Tax=Sphingorhabdus lutea TaxID=1913578 RepID=A0A1L3J9P8_9SPHN|nr:ligase-associated DNA damage response DEXH box helicase [Sphingorhabdus lutea]APG61848.1 DNA ligase-associated DEXH box helicase [Sphingorhabdus lutea]
MNKYIFPPIINQWFGQRGWRIRRHQYEMAKAAEQGQHALLVASTGAGKTLAGFLPTLADLIDTPFDGLHSIYVSPLKALAVDVERNLLHPINEMGLDIYVETRTGDTSSARKARQRVKPPHILLTTPESLSLLLSYPESVDMLCDVRRIIIDEVHAFANSKRGDLLALSLARLSQIAPKCQRVALSATIENPVQYQQWLSPNARADDVMLVQGESAAAPQLSIMLPENEMPWAGHSGNYAVPQILREIEQNNTSLIFCNTRFLAEFTFQKLWEHNDKNLPIGLHHGSLSFEARQKVEGAMAQGKLRALVCTSSLDLGVDWGDVDCVIQMGAPKGSSRLLQRIGRSNHRMDEPSRAILVPGNRFEYLETLAAFDAVNEGVQDSEEFRPGGLDVLAQFILGLASAGPFDEKQAHQMVCTAMPYRNIDAEQFSNVLQYVATGGYALRAYDKYCKLVQQDGLWRLSHPKYAATYRLNAGTIVDLPMLNVRFKNGRSLGKVEENFAAALCPGDCFVFAGLALEVISIKDLDLLVRAATRAASIPSYMGARLPLTTHLAARVREMLVDSNGWSRLPDDVRLWLKMQGQRSKLPQPDELLVENFPLNNLHYLAIYPFEGWNAHQSLGMLLTRRMENMGYMPMGFLANDYALLIWSVRHVDDVKPLFSPDILDEEFTDWIENSYLLKRAFREVAVISGLVERQHPGKRKSGRQVTFSTDLIYDVLKKYEPDHLLMQAAWADARLRMTDIGRLGDLMDRAANILVQVDLDRISPLAVPLLAMIGRENVMQKNTEDTLLIESQSLGDIAMMP